jgi:hypothetical protein
VSNADVFKDPLTDASRAHGADDLKQKIPTANQNQANSPGRVIKMQPFVAAHFIALLFVALLGNICADNVNKPTVPCAFKWAESPDDVYVYVKWGKFRTVTI